ncbi:MAG: hypothetical protein M1823_006951, partial [Watsoniomyces obsoletus]
QHHRYGDDCPENPEEQTRHFNAKLDRADRIHAQRESETPPAHIEREPARHSNHDNRNYEPHNAETPHYETDEDAEDVEDVACVRGRVRDGVREREKPFCEFTEDDESAEFVRIRLLHISSDARRIAKRERFNIREPRQSQRPNRQQQRNNNLPLQRLMHRHSQEVECQDDPRE